MKRRYSLLMKIIICILILILSVSCSANNHSSYETTEQPNNNDEKHNISDTNNEWSLEAIENMILNMDEVYEVKPSPDKKMIAYIKGDPDEWSARMFLWKEGESGPIETEGVEDRICELFWSPDSEYIFMDIGTSAMRHGIIFSIKDMKSTYSIGYIGSCQWSPDSTWVAIGTVNDVKPCIDVESEGSIDLTLLNVKTGDKKVIAEGTSELFYLPEEWRSDGTLIYRKGSFSAPNKEEVLEYISE